MPASTQNTFPTWVIRNVSTALTSTKQAPPILSPIVASFFALTFLARQATYTTDIATAKLALPPRERLRMIHTAALNTVTAASLPPLPANPSAAQNGATRFAATARLLWCPKGPLTAFSPLT